MKALIFGANGQDGVYLARVCVRNGITPVCIYRSKPLALPSSWQTHDWIFERGDVSQFDCVERLIKAHAPDWIFHLAAQSTIRHEDIFENHQTICTGSLNILEAIRRFGHPTRVFLTGSGLQFVNRGSPIDESFPFEAKNPYCLARIHSVYAARYFRTLGLHVYVGYLFHHDSPFRKPRHLSQKIASAVRRIAGGSNEFIEIGNVDVQKEWGFAGDIAEGIFLLTMQERVFEAVVGTGISHSVQEWVNACFRIIDKNPDQYIRHQQGFVPDFSRLVSNPQRLKSLGWKPTYNIDDLARMMVLEEV